jgi:hypothetical protein
MVVLLLTNIYPEVASEALLDHVPSLEHIDETVWFDLGVFVGDHGSRLVLVPLA